MPLNLYVTIFESGSVPDGWKPVKHGTTRYSVSDSSVLAYLQTLLPGKWEKVVSVGRPGNVHYFQHVTGHVAGVKHYEKRSF